MLMLSLMMVPVGDDDIDDNTCTVETVWATTLPFHEKVVAVDRWSPVTGRLYLPVMATTKVHWSP